MGRFRERILVLASTPERVLYKNKVSLYFLFLGAVFVRCNSCLPKHKLHRHTHTKTFYLASDFKVSLKIHGKILQITSPHFIDANKRQIFIGPGSNSAYPAMG